MGFVTIGLHESSPIALAKHYLIPIVGTACVLLLLRSFLIWFRTYWALRKFPGPSATFMYRTAWKNRRSFLNPKGGATAGLSEILLCAINNYSTDGICLFYNGFRPLVILSEASTAEVIFKDNVNVAKPFMYNFLDGFLGKDSLLTATGEAYRFQRKLMKGPLSPLMMDSFMDCLHKHAREFTDYLGKKPADKEILLFHEVSKCTMNVLTEAALGSNVNALIGDNQYGRILTSIQRMVVKRSGLPWMWPDALYYGFFKQGPIFKRNIEKMKELSSKFLKYELKTDNVSDTESPAKKPREFKSMLFKIYEEHRQFLPKGWLQNSIDGILFAGQDTTTTTTSWTVFMLGHHPEVQEKCRQELDRVMGSDPTTPVTSEHLLELTYLDAAIKETMRVYAPGPLIGRCLETDVQIKGKDRTYTIPAGVDTFISIYNIHRDPKYYPDPEKFDPERFLDENAPHKSHPYAFVPFSAGVRTCPGWKYGFVAVKGLVIHLLRNFKWTSTVPRDQLKMSWEIVMRVEGDLRVKLEPLRPIGDSQAKN